jgi:cardiolipin synthase A/B
MKTLPLTDGNAVTLLRNGGEFFPALLNDIRHAALEVRLETYIFEHDEVGLSVQDALVNAARRGVRVKLLIDGVGSLPYPREEIDAMRAAGVKVAVYRPERSRWELTKSRLRRLHRKICVIDGRIAFVGGINIISDFAPPNGRHPQLDYSVRLEGPIVGHIYRSAAHLWHIVRWSRLRSTGQRDEVVPVVQPAGDTRAAFVFRDNLGHRRDIEHAYINGIMAARQEIIIACAYFFPGFRIRRAIIRAARRGVRVVLLLQGNNDQRLLRLATHAMHARFLQHGVHVVEYTQAILHAKVAVIDDQWATVGSSNLDPFSLLLAREANVFVVSPHFVAQLRAALNEAIATGTVLKRESWGRRSLLMRVGAWCAYQAGRAILGLLGLARDYR